MVDAEPVRTRDGLTLRGRGWPAEPHRAGARGTVVIVHGLGEHIGRYAHVAQGLNRHGWSVVGYDQRGHGASDGARGRLARGEDLLVDLAAVLDAVRGRLSGRLVLLGHSLGGLVAARFVAGGIEPTPPSWSRGVDALVLSSPVLETGMTRWDRLKLAVLEPLAPMRGVANGIAPGAISRDPAVVAAYLADPAVHDRIAPRLVRFVVDAGAEVLALAPRWRVPTLLLWAGSDRCVRPSGSAAFAAAAPPEVVASRCFQPLFHEILNEPERDEVMAALHAWLDR